MNGINYENSLVEVDGYSSIPEELNYFFVGQTHVFTPHLGPDGFYAHDYTNKNYFNAEDLSVRAATDERIPITPQTFEAYVNPWSFSLGKEWVENTKNGLRDRLKSIRPDMTPQSQSFTYYSYINYLGWSKQKIRDAIVGFIRDVHPDQMIDVRIRPWTDIVSIPRGDLIPKEIIKSTRRDGGLSGFAGYPSKPKVYYDSIYRYLLSTLRYIDYEKALMSLENNALSLDIVEYLMRNVASAEAITKFKTREEVAERVRNIIQQRIRDRKEFREELSEFAPALILAPGGKLALEAGEKYGEKRLGPEAIRKEEIETRNLCSESNISKTEGVDLLRIVDELGILDYFPKGIKNYSKEEICQVIGKYFTTLYRE